MADYPTLRQRRTSGEPWRDPLMLDIARSGRPKGRRLQATKLREFEVEHHALTSAERDTLETFYDANRNSTFNFAWNDDLATVYVVMFADEDGIDWKRVDAGIWTATVRLIEYV